MNVGSKIKFYRNKKRFSQTELGELVGLDVGRVRTYESNLRKPKEKQLGKFADVLGCNIEDLKSYNVSDYGELRACLLECLVVGGKEFCIDYISKIDEETICSMREFFIKNTKDVLLNVKSIEYRNAMRK